MKVVLRDADRTVLWLAGEHDLATAAALSDGLALAISANDADLTVDLSEVTFIDAGTIGALVSGRNLLHGQSRGFTLRSPSGSARRVLEVCGLTGLIDPG